MRPGSLAQDKSYSIDVVVHALDYFEKNGVHYGAVILLQPTSPLRSGSDTAETAAYIMLKERSVDIDDAIDFLIAETLLLTTVTAT